MVLLHVAKIHSAICSEGVGRSRRRFLVSCLGKCALLKLRQELQKNWLLVVDIGLVHSDLLHELVSATLLLGSQVGLWHEDLFRVVQLVEI